uniref:Uncharacterized protein n=1 Tax=Myoviridae sp. ctLnO19 TaxID=2825085 RepID=A0A8S5P1Y7_9CAUD|nr:MAG TPA: hypothetical protein [Myoviridae sp. ctLnO19]DAX74557.1 MAG TPA: hypothetical protein [Caudoviricetes sp.]
MMKKDDIHSSTLATGVEECISLPYYQLNQ